SSPAARWSAATWRKTASGYGRYLAWLDEHDQLDPAAPIAERVNRKLLNRYLSDLEAVNRGHTIHSRIQELSDALWILVPSVDFGWIRRAAGRLRSATVPATNKLARMRPIETLVKESFGLMDWAEQAPGLSNLRRALLFRDAL